MKATSLVCCAALALTIPLSPAAAEVPDPIAVRGETLITRIHAQGAQIYECKADQSDELSWSFREPVATLVLNGKTVGRHYAGPHWELGDGSTVVAKLSGRAPGATSQDIPLLRLAVTERRGDGVIADATTVQRINTKGGVADGPCEKAGDLLSVPYSADYVFYGKMILPAGTTGAAPSR